MVVHVLVVCEKANFQGVSSICDKVLSSKYVYSLEVYKHNLILIIGSFLKKEFFNIQHAFSVHHSGKWDYCRLWWWRKLLCLRGRLLKTEPLSECQSQSFRVFFSVLSRQRQTLGTVPCNLMGLYLEKKSTLLHCKTLFGMLRHHRRPLKIFAEKVRVGVINLRASPRV